MKIKHLIIVLTLGLGLTLGLLVSIGRAAPIPSAFDAGQEKAYTGGRNNNQYWSSLPSARPQVVSGHVSSMFTYFDDFSDYQSGWPREWSKTRGALYQVRPYEHPACPGVDCAYSGDGYVIARRASSQPYARFGPSVTIPSVDYEIEYDVRWWDAQYRATYKVFFGSTSSFSDYYVLDVLVDDPSVLPSHCSYRLLRNDSDGDHVINDWRQSSAIDCRVRSQETTPWNHWKILRENNFITIYVNDTELGSWYDSTFGANLYFGVGATCYEGLTPSKPEFDNWSVIALSEVTCDALSNVSINGPTGGYIGEIYTFTSNITPTNATSPITYTWSSDGLDNGQGTVLFTTQATYRWSSAGSKSVQVTARNCGGQDFSASLTITITEPTAEGDDYEVDDTCIQSSTITTDGTVQARTFHDTGDEDWVTFDAISGTEYLVEGITPPDSMADIILEIYDSCSSAPGGGQDNTFSPDVRLRFSALQDGPLTLRLRNEDGAPAGPQASYRLSVRALEAAGTPGAVVIVAGKLKDDDAVQSNIHHVTNAVYQLFLDHGYPDDRIQYLATGDTLDTGGDGTLDVDAEANRANLEQAITQWAAGLVSGERAFTLYMMDHGGYDKFYLNGSAETVTPSDIAGWLDILEQAAPGVKINVIVDACKSGSFIDLVQSLSGPGRVVIASTGAQRLAWATEQGAIFSDHFIAALDRGLSLYGSFKAAKWAVEAAKPAQTPWLDDNGNGLHNEATDGALAAVRGFAHAGIFAEGEDEWPPHIVGMGLGEIVAGRGIITAEVRDNGIAALHVWAEIYPPTYTVPALDDATEIVVDTVPTVTLVYQGDGTLLQPGKDLYSVEYTGFSASGNDRVVVYARDENGLLSRPEAIGELEQQQHIYLPLILRN